MADIQFEFAAGAGDLLKELKQIKQEFVEIRDANASSKKEMSESFQQAAKGADEYQVDLSKALKKQVEQKEIIEQMTKKMLELEDAQSKATNTDDVNKYTQRIKQLEAEIDKLKRQAKGFGEESKKSNQQASESMLKLASTIEQARKKLDTLKQGSTAYTQLEAEIKAAELAANKLTVAFDENSNATGKAKTELSSMREALISLKRAGLDNTQVYRDLKQEAGQLSDTIGDVNEEFKASGSDTAGIDKLVRGIQVATGAAGIYEGVVALTGQRNEDFEKTMIRLNAVMTISNSLQAVMTELKRKDSVVTGIITAAQKLWTAALGQTAGAARTLRTALISTGIGALIVAIGVLIANAGKLKDAFFGISKEQKDIAESSKKSAEQENKKLDILDSQDNILKLQGKSEKEILALKIKQTDAVIEQREQQLLAQQELLKGQIEAEKRNKRVLAGIIDFIAKPLQFLIDKTARFANFTARIFGKGIDPAQLDKTLENAFSSTNEKIAGFFFDPSQVEEEGKETLVELQDQLLTLKNTKAGYQLQIRGIDKEGNDKRIKDAEAANKRLIELEKELAQARIDAMQEGRQKEIAAENNNFNNKVGDFERQRLTATLKERIIIDQMIEQEKLGHRARLLAIDVKYYEDAANAFKEAQKNINSVLLTDQDQEEQQLIDKYDAIFKSIEESRKKNLALANDPIVIEAINLESNNQAAAVTEKLEKEKLAIKEKYSLKQLQEAEALAIAQNDILKINGLTQEQLEQVKETNKLNIIIEFGKKRLAILEASGNAENELQIAQLKKVIQDAENALKKPKDKKTDIFEILGIDFGSEENKQQFIKAVGHTKDAIEALIGSLVQLQDQQVQKSQERMQLLEDELSAQEKAVDREKQLAEDGYANNLGLEQQKLTDLKKQKEEELKVQQEAQKKKEALQKIAIVADGIAQVSNLITAGSEIMKGFSTIPIIGVGLGIAAVALMIGAFVASKVAAFNAVSKAEKGRRVASGNRHGSGGNKYQSIDGNDPGILEIEEGEWVVNRKSSAKYDPLLEAINDDRLSAMSVPQLQRMLEPLGIRLQDDLPEKIVRQYEQVTYNNSSNITQQDNQIKGELKNQNRLLERIAANTEKTTEYYDGYRIEREGNRIRKIIEQ